jgi:hypothetical protein
MNERDKHYIEIYIAESLNDINKKIDFFTCITNCLFELANNPFEKKIKIKFHQQVLEAKAYRLAFANHSIITLINGSRVKILENEINSTDIDSLFSITRMQIETFLILHYLVFDDVDDETKDFRLNIYKLNALQKQKGFKLSPNFNDANNQLIKIEEEIKENIEAIKKSVLFNKATLTEQKEFLKPTYAKLIKSKEIFKRSGIQKSRLDQMWSIYSNYAHSEYISDRQHNHRINNPKDILNSVLLVLDINKMLTSRLIWNLKNLYKENIEKYDSFDLKDKVQIEMWKEI